MSIPPRILLADDDAEVRLGVADLLQGIGLDVLQVETGLEAVEIVKSERIQAALLDMYMPGCSGFEALPRIHELRAGLPCIVYSGRWTPGLERSVLAAGACACLRKPVDPDLLRNEVRRALELAPPDLWSLGQAPPERN